MPYGVPIYKQQVQCHDMVQGALHTACCPAHHAREGSNITLNALLEVGEIPETKERKRNKNSASKGHSALLTADVV